MKAIEEAFSDGGLRRVILSGVVLTLGVHPIVRPLTEPWLKGYDVGQAALPLIEVIFFGLIVSSSANWAYYVYEGFIGALLTKPGFSFHDRRHRKLKASIQTIEGKTLTPQARRRRAIFYEKLHDYPFRRKADGSLETYVDGPTLLANIIATYERYADRAYGVDGVFFWHHLLSLAPDTIRKEFDETYALAESLLLASFAGLLVIACHVVVLAGILAGRFFAIAPAPISVRASVTLLLIGFVATMLFYVLALPVHRDAGRIFRALVDLSIPQFRKCVMKASTSVDAELKKKSTEMSAYLGAGRTT